jgi:hypothetical protein
LRPRRLAADACRHRTQPKERKQRKDKLLLYDSKDLVTHAVCVGMTGSGKTGLCLALLEEAALNGILPSLPKGTRIDVRLTYDNSAGNLRNPSNPPKRVSWGEESFDEMGSVSVAVQAVQKEDEAALQQLIGDRTRAAIGSAMRNGTLQRYQEHQQAGRGGAGQNPPKEP